ncbi:hypothetical protein [Pseudophaeobacter sp. 1A09344]|uniref:hypothetical protein n=1 Tax=Pseudophaeobacter sp. 1A09344 TaxID=3098144 RepID=UPI0034D67FB4
MERIKSFLASALIALIVFAGFGFGIMAVGFAIVLGGAFALALRLAGPRLMEEAEKRAAEVRVDTAEAEPATA